MTLCAASFPYDLRTVINVRISVDTWEFEMNLGSVDTRESEINLQIENSYKKKLITATHLNVSERLSGASACVRVSA
jgi:hypothetical protein